MQALRAREARLQALGYTHERWIEPDELFERVPALARHCRGALIAERDGAALPFRSTQAFRRRAEALGQRVLEGVRVLRVAHDGSAWHVHTTAGEFSAGTLVNCAGAWADRVCEQVGEPVPLQAIAPMMMVTLRMPPFLQPVILGSGRPLSFKQTREGTLLIGGGRRARVDRDAETTELDWHELAASARTVRELFPRMADAVVNRGWAGIEARMPDDLPVLGRGRAPALIHQFGFSAHGFELGPICGRIVTELVTRGDTALPIAPFAIGRFG